jgi:tripartite-type tricarboxylate transporter receptor subunit TctC
VVAPDVPTVAETLPEFESSQWWAAYAPAGTPSGIISRLNTEIAKLLGDADLRERFAVEGAEAVGGSPQDFAVFLRADYEKWGKVAKQAGIRPE